jgi:hypothetical protein
MNFQLPFQALYLVLLLPTVLAKCFPLRPQRPLQSESTLPKIATVIRQEKPSRFLMTSSKVLILPSDIQKQRMTAQINDSFLGPENQNIGLNAIQNWIGIVENNLQLNLGEGDVLITEQSNSIHLNILDEYKEKYLADN